MPHVSRIVIFARNAREILIYNVVAFWVHEKGVQLGGAGSPRGVDMSVMKVRCRMDRRRDDRDRIPVKGETLVLFGEEVDPVSVVYLYSRVHDLYILIMI